MFVIFVPDGTIPKGAVYMLGVMSYDEVMNRKNRTVDPDVVDGGRQTVSNVGNNYSAVTEQRDKVSTEEGSASPHQG